MKVLALSVLVSAIASWASPALAQMDLSGEWRPRFWEDQPERVPGPELGEFSGVPINDAARLRGEAWNASWLTLPEWQCRPHPGDYIWRGPSNLSITKEIDPISREVSQFNFEWLRSVRRPIYLDDRPRPSVNAPHTWAGFSKATWRGDILVIKTDHLKESFTRRNGLPRSDRGTLTEYLIRNDDLLTVFVVIKDPTYLTEPYVHSTDYDLNLRQVVPPYPCHVVEEVIRPAGQVPHNLPGTDRSIEEHARAANISVEDARGGAATMYPRGRTFVAATGDSRASTRPGVPIDLTGQWVPVVTEDWRWRMMTPPKGDHASIPLNAEGIKLLNAWDPARDRAEGGQCRAYAPPGLIRMPGQIRLSWQDDTTMKLEAEAGTQTRLLHFGQIPATAPSLQGTSRATWTVAGRPLGQANGRPNAANPSLDGQLRVLTTGLLPGYLRKNGVPFSENARLTEYYNRVDDDENGESWLIVLTVVDDPQYLNQRWFTSTHFKRVVSSTPWSPSPCSPE